MIILQSKYVGQFRPTIHSEIKETGVERYYYRLYTYNSNYIGVTCRIKDINGDLLEQPLHFKVERPSPNTASELLSYYSDVVNVLHKFLTNDVK